MSLETERIFFENRVHRSIVLGRKVYHAKDGIYYFVTSERVGVSEQNGVKFPVRHYSIRRVKGGSVTYAEGTVKNQFPLSRLAHAHAAKLGTHQSFKKIPEGYTWPMPVVTSMKPLSPASVAPKGEVIERIESRLKEVLSALTSLKQLQIGGVPPKPKSTSPKIPFEWIGSQSQD